MTTDNWLPSNYERPKSSGGNYFKFADGSNKLRILSAPIMGYLYWTKDNKPVRSPEPFKGIPDDARLDEGKFKPKHFWAFVVWNYADTALQIMEITQASIQGPLQDFAMNDDWGDPRNYDVTITKKGEGLDTEYSVIPSPQKAVPAEAHKAYRETPINLDALFTSGDPFTTSAGSEVADAITPDDSPFGPDVL